jgi:hypothetical protein
MMTLADVEGRREEVLARMSAIRSMKRATLSVRYEKVLHKGQREPVLRGPYGLLVWREGKRNKGRRLRSPKEVAQAREEVAGYKRFKTLCEEFVVLTERLGELERQGAASEEALKKGLKWRSSGAGKSRG